jgi:hypothetical protein
MDEDLKNRPAETAVLDTVTIEQPPHATPRKRGRPLGSRNRDAAEAAEEAQASQGKLFLDMRDEGLLFFGETAPLVNCINIEEEIEMAKIWAKLLDVRDIQQGENPKAYILEVLKEWCIADCPLLHLQSLKLSKRFVEVADAMATTGLKKAMCPISQIS